MSIGRRDVMIGGAAAVLAAGPARALAQGGGAGVPIRLTDSRLLVAGSIGQSPTLPMVIDTGGQFGLIRTDLARQLKLPKIGSRKLRLSWGNTDYPIYRANGLLLGGRFEVPVLALAGIDRGLGDGAAISLPGRVLTVMDGELDMDAGQWRVYPGGLGDMSGWTRFDKGIVQRGQSEDSRFLYADASINGAPPMRFGLDTGMPPVIRLYRKAAEAAGLWNAAKWAPAAPDGETRVVRAEQIELAGAVIERPLVFIKDRPDWNEFENGIIGLPLLRLFNIATSNRDNAVLMKRNRQTMQPDYYNRTGIWIERAGDAIAIGKVGAGSPAEQAGLQPGDRIRGIPFETFIQRIYDPAGTVLNLTVERGGASRAVPLTLTDYL
ncbi:aspartyl protease family protein [Sphingomonas sp. CJ99]